MDWTEECIRKETGWKAFREGQAIARHGKVTEFKRGDELLTGAFKDGRRTIRTVVRTGDVLAVECGCAANRATGEVCAHGVALLLSAISEAPPAVEQVVEAPPTGELVACQVSFPEQLGKMLSAGRLSAQIDRCNSAPDQADAVLSMWLARNAPGSKFPKLLSLGTDKVDEFLVALSGHLRISSGGKPVIVSEDRLAPLRLSRSEHRGSRVILKVASGVDLAPIRWGKELGVAARSEHAWHIGRLPVEAPSLIWRDEAAELISNGELELSQNEFLENADAWLDLFQSPLPGWLGELRFEPASPQFTLKLEGSLNALDAHAEFTYPGLESLPLSSIRSMVQGLPKLDGEGVLRMRDSAQEQRGLERLLRTGFSESGRRGEFTLHEPAGVLAFLADDLPKLKRDWKVIVGDRLSHVLKSLHVIRPKLESTQSLAWDLSFQTDAGKAIPEQKIREILRSGKRSVKTANGVTVAISREIPEMIEPLLADLGIVTREGKIQVDKARDLLFREYREKNNKALNSNALKPKNLLPIPLDLNAELRAYQHEGYSWLVERLRSLSGVLLADEMGLGKTIQTIAAIIRLKQDRASAPALILVPTSLLGNWRDEIQRFAPKMRFVVLHGGARDKLRDDALSADVIITSYGTLCRDLAFHLQQTYGLLVADEASLLRNPDSEVSRSVAKLSAEKRLALTGTPVENRLRDLWSIFRVVAPGYLGSKAEFEERYQGGDSADPSLHDRLRLRISPFVLRRTKSEVAKDLPEKIEIDEWLDLDPDARQTYAAIAKAGLLKLEEMEDQSGGGRMHLLTLLLRLRQLCLDPRLIDDEAKEGSKSQRLIEILLERSEIGGKTLVFSQFRKYLGLIRKSEKLAEMRVFSLDGSTRNRAELVRDFQKYEGPAVFLISLKAGGYGLNLTAADTVIHMDPWWNPAVEAQASDRAHRIGQTQPVTIYKLLTRDSVEERVRRMQSSKRAMIDSISGDAAPANWTEADFRSLIS